MFLVKFWSLNLRVSWKIRIFFIKDEIGKNWYEKITKNSAEPDQLKALWKFLHTKYDFCHKNGKKQWKMTKNYLFLVKSDNSSQLYFRLEPFTGRSFFSNLVGEIVITLTTMYVKISFGWKPRLFTVPILF